MKSTLSTHVNPNHRSTLRICIDRVLPHESSEAQAPPLASHQRLAADRRKVWPGQWRILAVRFLEGDPHLHARIAAIAGQWTRNTGLRFDFNNAPGAPIRVAFTSGPSWSYIGTDALDPRIGPDEPTLNFGWLTPATPNDEVMRVVLHEFGHALGMIHEHQSPRARIPWNKEAVYRYYAGPPNYWTPDEVDANVFDRYKAEATNASCFDPHSIMLYPIPQEFTDGRFEVGWNQTLSTMDREHIARIYPINQD